VSALLRWLRRRWLPAAGAFVLVSAGVLGAASRFGGFIGAPAVSLFDVERGRFLREVGATGTLKAVKATPILVPLDIQGTQKVAWIARDGSSVKAGDPVVLFDPTEMQRELKDGQADKSSAENKIDKTQAESRSTTGGLALDRDLARDEKTRAADFAPKNLEIFSRNEIIESQIDIDLLGKRSETADAKLVSSDKLGKTDLALGEIERSKAEIKIRQAEKSLGSLRILAPHDGLIVMERGWRGETIGVGETVWPGQKIAEIPDLSALEAEVYVLEADAGSLEPGRAAKVMIEGKPGKVFNAKVSRVDAIAKTRDRGSPIKYFETILTLDATDGSVMKPGQKVRARIVLEEAAGVISIPRGAIFDKDGKRVVYRLRDGRFEAVEVSIGHNSLARVVVEKGLDAGDRIALRDPSRTAGDIFSAAGSEAGKGAGGQDRR
jgi:HlyD family secretion protein